MSLASSARVHMGLKTAYRDAELSGVVFCFVVSAFGWIEGFFSVAFLDIV